MQQSQTHWKVVEDRGIVGPIGPGGSRRQILVFDDIIE